jgi:Glycosyl hydrolase family 53
MKRGLSASVLVVLTLVLSIFVSSCGSGKEEGDNSDDNGTPAQVSVIKGFGISPQGFPLDYGQIAAFYAEVSGMTGGGVMWNGLWKESGAGTVPQAAASLMQASSAYEFTPVVVFGWRSGTTLFLNVPSNGTNNWSNAAARDLFQSMLVDYATTYKPPYLFLGNESDAYYEQNASDYANWISFYNSAYDAIKSASTDTMVGPVFNFEHMAGTGALNGWTTAYWGALESHDLSKVDIIGVTVYPFLNYASPGLVLDSYLDPLISRIGSKPIAITETGWPAENLGALNPLWETSGEAQVTYLSRLDALLEGKNVKMVNWLHLYAMQDTGGSPTEWRLFSSVSLRDISGNKRPVYDAWLSFDP